MMLAADGKKIIIICTDHNMLAYQLILERKHSAEHKSLGRILSTPVIDARMVLDNAIPFQEKREKVLSFIMSKIRQKQGDNVQMLELVNRLYTDMESYSVLTEPLEDDFVEGINVNSWNDIRVKYFIDFFK